MARFLSCHGRSKRWLDLNNLYPPCVFACEARRERHGLRERFLRVARRENVAARIAAISNDDFVYEIFDRARVGAYHSHKPDSLAKECLNKLFEADRYPRATM